MCKVEADTTRTASADSIPPDPDPRLRPICGQKNGACVHPHATSFVHKL